MKSLDQNDGVENCSSYYCTKREWEPQEVLGRSPSPDRPSREKENGAHRKENRKVSSGAQTQTELHQANKGVENFSVKIRWQELPKKTLGVGSR